MCCRIFLSYECDDNDRIDAFAMHSGSKRSRMLEPSLSSTAAEVNCDLRAPASGTGFGHRLRAPA
jgi:hypothetical protein